MSSPSLTVLTAFALAMLPLFVIGYLIRQRGMIGLINGIDLSRVRDSPGLRRFAGLMCYLLGAAGLVAGALMALAPERAATIMIAYVAANVALVIRLITGLYGFVKG